MASPPVMVKLALEAICILLGENVGTDWKAIRGVMVKDDFMPRILAFDTDSITTDILKQMDKYVNNPDWDFDKVNRASQACGPMVKWAKAQLLYSGMLHKVEPLRNELKRLESDAKKKTTEGNEVKARIAQLEQSIAAYKEEYAQLIGQAESIKMDLATVQEKVGRSTELLSSLRSERDRWSGGCDGFAQQMDTLVGDALLSGAFLAYAGYFDQQLRDVLFHRWIDHVQGAGVKFRQDLARIEYLSTVDDRLQWQKNALPVEPAVEEAQQAVKGIRKNQLVEVRSMASPPVMVKLALEAICILLGENVGTDWKAIRGVMVKDDFMPRILAFDTDSITTDILKQMDKYVMRNLHVVFTMNPSGSGLRERASTSPALFNRCVLNWFGDWADTALYQVGSELTTTLDMDRTDYEPPFSLPIVCDLIPTPPTYRHAVINTLVHVHKSVQKLNEQEQKRGHRVMVVTPRHFLDLIKHFMNLFHEKRRDLEEEKVHLNIGLNKIRETEEQVKELQKSLTLKSRELEEKKTAANLKVREMLADQQK
ncbi:hypothetical protein ANCDUO_17609, partial [Ancylostoma duodenale]